MNHLKADRELPGGSIDLARLFGFASARIWQVEYSDLLLRAGIDLQNLDMEIGFQQHALLAQPLLANVALGNPVRIDAILPRAGSGNMG